MYKNTRISEYRGGIADYNTNFSQINNYNPSKPNQLPSLSQVQSKNETPIGLQNIGNTCYMQSLKKGMLLFNALSTVHLFKNISYKIHINNIFKPKQKAQLIVLPKLFKNYQIIKMNLHKNLKNAQVKLLLSPSLQLILRFPLRRCNFQFQTQMFLRFFFEAMGKELNKVSKKPKYQELKADITKNSLQEIVIVIFRAIYGGTTFQDLFTGQFLNTVTCMNCEHVSIGFDNFQEVSVAFTQGLRKLETFTLDRMLHAFIKEEIVNSEIRCEKCKKQNKFKKKLDFYKTPEILIIHIKRFKFGSYIKEKLTQAVCFGQTLDLKPYIQNTLNRQNQLDKSNQNTTYELFGIVNHSGTLNGGHYTSEVKVIDKWYNFNDSMVSKIDNNKIDQYQTQGGTNPYVLYYKKVQGSSNRISNL